MEEGSEKLSIKNWAEDDRPREKLLLKGKSSLSHAELLAILISTGTRDESAVDLGKKILASSGNKLDELAKFSVKDLQKIKGIGQAKAITIVAALELGRRRREEEARSNPLIQSATDAVAYFEPLLGDLQVEEFWVLFLARNNKVLARRKISEGGVSGTVVDPKVIFKAALEELASGIILCHNHPSGSVSPSHHDLELTKRLCAAGKLLDITVQDHIIIGSGGNFYSFANQNQI